MRISYACTVCNEFLEIQKLVTFLLENKRDQDEIVILYDAANGDERVEEYLRAKSVNSDFFWHQSEFEGHFANWKNKLNTFCNGDWIMNIDADEQIPKTLLSYLPAVLESNPDTDLFWVPRVNTVEGLTPEDIAKWRWNVNEKGHVNWPDLQPRLYKKKQGLIWENKVHERLKGYSSYATLPLKEEWALLHPKDIDRQRRQNSFYDSL